MLGFFGAHACTEKISLLTPKNIRRLFAGAPWALAEPPLEVSTEMVCGELKLLIPGQPAYTLVLQSDNKFAIKEAPAGYFALFNVADGKIKSLTMIQDTASYTLLAKP